MKQYPVFVSLALSAALVIALCLAFPPQWETNDDVGMSMVAHGYGFAAYGSPNILFSNVLWGHIVRAMPEVNGVLGYSVATMSILLLIGWATIHFLLRLGTGLPLTLLMVMLLMARPVLFPQFTINAGLLTVAAILGAHASTLWPGRGILMAACLLAFLGYLVRSLEFFLVLAVALPLLPWRVFLTQRRWQVAFLSLFLAVAAAALFNHYSYEGNGWQHFLELNPARIPFTDLGAGEYLKARPDILTRYGYSHNDINLLQNWFFVDNTLADPSVLNAMLTDLGPLPTQSGNLHGGYIALAALATPALLCLLVPAFLLFLIRPGWALAATWILCVIAIFATGVFGRPGIVRVYIPLICLLVVAPMMVAGTRQGSLRNGLVGGILVVAIAANAWYLLPEVISSKRVEEQVKGDIMRMPAGSIVTWGGGFPYEAAYPVFANDRKARGLHLHALGVLTYAPYSTVIPDEMQGAGLLSRLFARDGVALIASPNNMAMLRIYCSERGRGKLKELRESTTPTLTVRYVRCEAQK